MALNLLALNRSGKKIFTPAGMAPWVGGEPGTSSNIEDFIGTPQEQQQMWSMMNPAGNAASNPTGLTMNRLDNPGFEGVGVGAKNRVQGVANDVQADFNNWLKQASQVQGANAQDTAQESKSIGGIYDGTIKNDLTAQRTDYGKQAKSLAQSTADMLAKIRGDYGATQGGMIDRTAGDLAGQRSRFAADTNAGINKEQADRNAWLRQYDAEARGMTDQSIGDASADAKAMMVAGGGAGESLLNNRMGTIRTRANAALTQDLADKQKGILDAIRSQQAALTQQLGGWERGDIQDIAGQRYRLGDTMNAQGRADTLYGAGVDEALNRELYGAGRADTGYLTGLQMQAAGARRGLRNAGLTDAMLPITARNGLLRDELSNMSAAAGIYDQTGSTLLDDPSGRFRPQTFTPRSQYRELPQPYYPDVPASDYSGYGGGYDYAPAAAVAPSAPRSYYDPNWRQNSITSDGRDFAALNGRVGNSYYVNDQQFPLDYWS
ncbi:MAG: hypothetical protein RL254_969 [Planctomycetota bacterium]|jgi:hypothetical protein